MVKHQSSAKWKAIARRLILCEFSGWSEWNKKNQITKFGYSGHLKNQIFGYLVIRFFGWPE
jgi:hypothetical protein